jgi:hypothetical protein
MASTLTAGNLIDVVKLKFPKVLVDGFGARAADEVHSYIWKRYPWKSSIANLYPFHVVQAEPDYGPPSVTIPLDFQGFHQVWLRSSDGREYRLDPKPDLQKSFTPGLPNAIAWMPKDQAFRLHPRPSFTAPDWWVEGEYKKTPTKINNENVASFVLPYDDMYAMVFRKGLAAWFKQDTPDEMPAFQMFSGLLDEMAASEGLLAGPPQNFPDEGLANGGWEGWEGY